LTDRLPLLEKKKNGLLRILVDHVTFGVVTGFAADTSTGNAAWIVLQTGIHR